MARMGTLRLSFRSSAAVLFAAALLGFALFAWPETAPAVRERGPTAARAPETSRPTKNSSVFLSGAAPTSKSSPDQTRVSTAEQYLRQLDALSRSDKAAALKLAQKPAEGFPEHGVLAEAREALSITLLVDLGRMAEARDEVRRFIQSHPQSRYRPLVQGVTGIHPRPTRPQIP